MTVTSYNSLPETVHREFAVNIAMNKDTPPQKPERKYLTDADGNTVVSKYGHAITAKLTDEDKANIDKLKANGTSNRAICKELAITDSRLVTYLRERETAERIMAMTMTTELPGKLTNINALLVDLVNVVAKMEVRMSDVQTELKETKKLAYRQKQGRAKAERELRSQRTELRRVRDALWKVTGKRK